MALGLHSRVSGMSWGRDFPGGPVAKSLLPMQGSWVQSLVKGARSHMAQLQISHTAMKMEDPACHD